MEAEGSVRERKAATPLAAKMGKGAKSQGGLGMQIQTPKKSKEVDSALEPTPGAWPVDILTLAP